MLGHVRSLATRVVTTTVGVHREPGDQRAVRVTVNPGEAGYRRRVADPGLAERDARDALAPAPDDVAAVASALCAIARCARWAAARCVPLAAAQLAGLARPPAFGQIVEGVLVVVTVVVVVAAFATGVGEVATGVAAVGAAPASIF